MQAQLKSTLSSKDIWRNAKKQAGWEEDTSCTSLLIDGQVNGKGKVLSEHMNSFFVDKVEKIKAKIPVESIDPLDFTRKFIKDKWVPEFRLGTTVDREVIKIITEVMFDTHIYTFGGKLFKQRKGGLIGLRGTHASIARLIMCHWDLRWKDMRTKNSIKLEEYIWVME